MTSDLSQDVEIPSDTDLSPLFAPFKLGQLELANRFVMAPMTRAASIDGVPRRDIAEYYARRAHLGLIVTEGTYIDHPSAGNVASVPRMYGEASLAGWKGVVDAVHAAGGKIIPQLWHVGVTRAEGSAPHPEAPTLSPSAVALDGSQHGRSATTEDIDALIAGFARSAKAAKEIGFDGVELHGAHGYLLDEFLWDTTNQRTDAYGGDIAGRVRLSAEIVAAVRAEVGPDYPISFRFSQWKAFHFDAKLAGNPQELEQFLTPLADAGVDLWHVSTRRYWLPAFDESSLTLAGWTKQLTGMPTIGLGSVGVRTPFLGADSDQNNLSLAPLMRLYEAGEFDLVGIGRAILSDPEWTLKMRSGDIEGIRQYEKGHEQKLY